MNDHSLRPNKYSYSIRVSLSAGFISIVLLTSISLGSTIYFTVRAHIVESIQVRLLDFVKTAALQIDPEQHALLTKKSQKNSDTHLALQKQLARIQDISEDIRYVYTLRMRPDGKIEMVVDQDNGPCKVYKGEISDEMRLSFSKPYKPRVESDFTSDKWGTWLSAYAPVIDTNGNLECVIGADISARLVRAYQRTFLLTILLISFLVSLAGVALGLLFSRKVSRSLNGLSNDISQIQRLNLEQLPSSGSKIKEIFSIQDAVENMKKGLRSFKRYVPAELVTELIQTRREAVLEVEKREMTVMFSDIVNFGSHL